MSETVKLLGNSDVISSTASNFNKARAVRVTNNAGTNSVVTVQTADDTVKGTVALLSGHVITLVKEPTDEISATPNCVGTAVAFSH